MSPNDLERIKMQADYAQYTVDSVEEATSSKLDSPYYMDMGSVWKAIFKNFFL